jgi:hypothetical protein
MFNFFNNKGFCLKLASLALLFVIPFQWCPLQSMKFFLNVLIYYEKYSSQGAPIQDGYFDRNVNKGTKFEFKLLLN